MVSCFAFCMGLYNWQVLSFISGRQRVGFCLRKHDLNFLPKYVQYIKIGLQH